MTEQPEGNVIRVGSRKSELALIQTKHVIGLLQELHPEKRFEIHTMSTIGDRVLNVSLPKIGEKSLFTRDLEDALRRGGVDFVVHSLKDLPTALPPGMAIGAVLEREDPRDALVLNEKYAGKTLSTLPKGSVIGTSSLRRTAQLRRKYPHLEIVDIRGNLNTRLAKLDAATSKFAGIILAQAGLVRMGWQKRISQILEPIDVLYAVGQGALAVECRSNDAKILSMLNELVCIETSCKILAERSFLKTLGGGCSAPVAVTTSLDGSLRNNNKLDVVNVRLSGAVWSLDGSIEIQDAAECCLAGRKLLEVEGNNTTDDNDNETPRKKLRLSESEAEPVHDKQGSPKVIDEDVVPDRGSGDASQVDVQYLIDVHGELFKRCPYYALHEKDAKNGNSSQKIDECPLKIPIGQDFMGKCPYVGVDDKVQFAAEGKCPVSGKTAEDLLNCNKGQDESDRSNSTQDAAIPAQCPFSKQNTLKQKDLLELKPDSCPFLKNKPAVKMIDCDLNKSTVVDNEEETIKIVDDSDSLFCGMFRHDCYGLELFKRCEELGRRLANNLIEKGALDVMQRAQNEIHGKIQ
ncbi:unnamed protein product [Hermetia illucens]|uniref:hydroxymethylbilane synthase n=1 Tax=Hermetia illucens TaxID=343691 RepID=A0A7R8UGA1_HERIL|nr:uncharacterized protein LOC119648883 [Hermetia illucens]CAD7080327.1 unnamed protein product [Hermetia illucens]